MKKTAENVPAQAESQSPTIAPAETPGTPRIRLDETNAKLSYANFFNVSSTREETALLFGMIQASPASSGEIVIQVSDRVVMTPHAARRLQSMLGQVLHAVRISLRCARRGLAHFFTGFQSIPSRLRVPHPSYDRPPFVFQILFPSRAARGTDRPGCCLGRPLYVHGFRRRCRQGPGERNQRQR